MKKKNFDEKIILNEKMEMAGPMRSAAAKEDEDVEHDYGLN